MKIKKEHLLLAGILLVGIIVRLIKFEDPVMVMDSVAFSRLGKNLIEFGRYAFGENYNMGVFFPPGYPFFIGVANLFFNDLFFSAKMVSLIASNLTVVLSYFIGKELYDKEAGLFAALVYALYPVILIISVDAYSDVLFFFFVLLTIYIFIVSHRKSGFLYHALFGISMSVAFLVRPEGIFFFLLPGLNLFGVFNKRIRLYKEYFLPFVLICTIFVLSISPYMIFLKNYTGKLTLSGKANVSLILGELSGENEYHDIVNAQDNLYDRAAFVLNEDKTQLRGWNKKTNMSLKDYLLKDPVVLIKRYQKNVMRQISTLIKLMIPIMLPFFLAFINPELFKNRFRLIFLMYPCIFFLMYPFFIIIEKQTMFIVLFLIFFASGGFSRAGSIVSEIAGYYGMDDNGLLRGLNKCVKPAIVAVLVLASFSYIKYSSFDKGPRLVEHKKGGLFLKEKLSPGYEEINVMGRKPYVSYYSQSRFTMIPYADIPEVIDFAKLYKVDYIVIDERTLGKWDYYSKLKQLQVYSDEVELFYESSEDTPIRLFKLNRTAAD